MMLFAEDRRRSKGYTTGTHRTRPPADTVRDYARVMPRLGITRLANVTGLDRVGLPVYVAVRPNSRGLSVSQGKGLDRDAARASALMESIELWHGEWIEAPLRHESCAALGRTVPVIDVTRLARRAHASFRDDQPLLWIEGYDLLQQRSCWVPFETVSTNFVLPLSFTPTFFMSSNGLASGNDVLEATHHAICELIERDAVTLWHLRGGYGSRDGRLDLATVRDVSCRTVIDALTRAGVDVWAWDITSDAGIPAYACAITEREDRPRWRTLGAFSGYGCHPAPDVALLRAMSEAYQSRLTVISGSRDDLLYRDYARKSNPDELAALLDRLRAPHAPVDFGARRSLASATFEDDLTTLTRALRATQVASVVVVNLTREEIGIPVVKVVATDLEPLLTGFQYAPGRRARHVIRETAR